MIHVNRIWLVLTLAALGACGSDPTSSEQAALRDGVLTGTWALVYENGRPCFDPDQPGSAQNNESWHECGTPDSRAPLVTLGDSP